MSDKARNKLELKLREFVVDCTDREGEATDVRPIADFIIARESALLARLDRYIQHTHECATRKCFNEHTHPIRNCPCTCDLDKTLDAIRDGGGGKDAGR